MSHVFVGNKGGRLSEVFKAFDHLGAEITVVVTKDHVTVADFGAVGDGVADDTTAIQNAVAAANAGDTVFLPQGVYRTTDTIHVPTNVVITGAAPGGTLSAGYGTVINPDVSGMSAFTINENVAGSSIKDLSIVGDGTSSLTGIKMEGNASVGSSTWLKFERLRFYKLNKGIYANTLSTAWQIDNVTITSCRFNEVVTGVHINSANATMWSVEDCFIAANTCVYSEHSNGLRLINCDGSGNAGGDDTFFRHKAGYATRIEGCQNENATYFVKYEGVSDYADGTTIFMGCVIDRPIICPVNKKLVFIGNYFSIPTALDLTGATNPLVFAMGNQQVSSLPIWSMPAGGRLVDLDSANPLVVGDFHTSQSFVFDTVGYSLKIKEGTNAKSGTVTLNGATPVVVPTTAVNTLSRIQLTHNVPGGTPGFAYVSSRVSGVSFSVKGTAGDTSTLAWIIFDPA